MINAASFTLEGKSLNHLKKVFSVFSDLDTVVFSGEKGGNGVTTKLVKYDKSSRNSFDTNIGDIDINEDFSFRLPKNELRALLNANDTFDVGFYKVGDGRQMSEFKFSNDYYELIFYITPLKDN